MLDILTLAAARKYTDTTAISLEEKIEDMSALKFKGVKEHIVDLPLTGEIGDFWLVEEDNNEYFWTGSAWEAFGGVISTDNFMSIDFVDSLPESNISMDKYYSIIARDNLYPDASNLIVGDLPRIMISLVDGEYRAVTTNRSDYDGFFDYNYGRPSWIVHQKYNIVNNEWVANGSQENSNTWASYLGITDRNNLGDLKYCNHRLCSEINTNPVWNPTGTEGNNINTVKITGEPISSAGYNMNIWAVYKRENNDWTKLGNFNFTSVFENIVGVKLDKNQNSTNAGKFMKVGSDGNLTPENIDIPSVVQTTGQSTVDVMSQKAITDTLATKLDTNQGSANEGKVMTVGADGSLSPQTASGGTTDYTDLTNKPSINSVTLSGNKTGTELGLFDAPLIFTNVSATFTANSDTGYEDYDYKAVLTCQGVTASMLATVIFSEEQATSGNYALTCVTGTDSVTIYSNDNTAITVPTVIAGSPVEVQFNNAEVETAMDEIIGGEENE